MFLISPRDQVFPSFPDFTSKLLSLNVRQSPAEANWRDVGKSVPPGRKKRVVHDMTADFMTSESPRYVGRAVVALASDPKAIQKTGRVFSSWALAKEYKFTDLDGTRPDWGGYARKRYGKYKVCDEKFYSYWTPGLVEMIFRTGFEQPTNAPTAAEP